MIPVAAVIGEVGQRVEEVRRGTEGKNSVAEDAARPAFYGGPGGRA